jgi:hypothetical protein
MYCVETAFAIQAPEILENVFIDDFANANTSGTTNSAANKSAHYSASETTQNAA